MKIKMAMGVVGLLAVLCATVLAQVVDNRSFKALPRPIHYETPLCPAQGPQALIVYGKEAPWTRKAAEAVRQAIQAWALKELKIVDDRTVTSDETWLIADEYRNTPLIVLGSAQDNRVMHALGTRLLLRSNRTWPGGDRFIIRTVFEPFVADVNYIVLEASNEAGMDGAVAQFAELLKTYPKDAAATIPPRLRVVGAVKDKWEKARPSVKLPPEWTNLPNASVSELIQAFKGAPVLAGTPAMNAGITWEIWNYTMGGSEGPATLNLDPLGQRALAAMCLLGCRAQGGRTHGNYDHYGALGSFTGIRAVLQTGVLTPQEVNEFESCMVLSNVLPLDYLYNQFGAAHDMPVGTRHWSASLLSTAHAVRYIVDHCSMAPLVRKEIERRTDAVHKSAVRLVRAFREQDESDSGGENVLMHVSTLLHEGLMENVRNGNLRRSAEFFLLSADNMPGLFGGGGLFIGLSGFSSGPGGILFPWYGGGLVEEAGFYYDDPQYRWLANNWAPIKSSRGGGYLPFHTDIVDKMAKPVVPTTYDGVRALSYDERLYNLLIDPVVQREGEFRSPPESLAKAADRVAFRDDFDTRAAYLFLATSSSPRKVKPAQNNMIARFTDLAEVWLFTNMNDNSGWVRSLVSISDGKGYIPRSGCTVEALANLGEISAVASREQGVAGSDYTRTIVHWRGHYFVVLDRMEALQDSEFAFVCRWRSPQLAALQNGVWTAVAPSGSKMRIQNTEPLIQTSEYWEIDGAARPYVLQQYKKAKLARGQAQTFQNLLFVSGSERPDEFEARQVGLQAMLVRGKTTAGDHLALIGVCGQIPLADFETDAAIYDVVGNTLHLASVTTLKARVGMEMQEIFWAQKPVNLLVECDTGKGEIEVRGDIAVHAKAGQTWAALKPGRAPVVLAQADVLPKSAALVEALWNRSKAPAAGVTGETAGQTKVFEARPGAASLQRPLKRLTNANITSAPLPNSQRRSNRMWNNTDNLEITLTLPDPTTLGCLRLVAVNKPPPVVTGRNPTGGEWIGTPGQYYEAGDMKFSLVLSDDGFKNDVRKIDAPSVAFEYTCYPPAAHTSMQHFGTWRIEVGQKAREVKLLPRATTRERAKLDLKDIELYGAQRVDELSVKVSVADLDGDGSNELIVGTSEKQLAAYDAQGKQLWVKTYPGDILRMDTADLDGDGKAQAIAYLMTETLHRVNGDGTERPGGDVLQAERDANHGCWGVAGAAAMAVWSPDGETKKEVLLLSERPYRVLADGSVKLIGAAMDQPLGCGRLVNLYPNEPEALVMVGGRGVSLWSARRDKDGSYTSLGSKPQVSGPDGGALGWVQQVDAPNLKGFLAAYQGGINYYPIAAFQLNSNAQGWEFSSGGVPAVAALTQDIDGDGVPEVFMARLDGFVNVLKLADGSSLGTLSTGEPILSMAVLKGKDGKPRLAVGTKFAVHLFGPDLKPLGKQAISSIGFAGPGGKERDRVYVVDAAGKVTVLVME